MAGNYSDEMLVSYGSLDQAATQLANEAAKLEAMLGEIKQKVASVAAGWEGEAHTMYTEQQAIWDREASDIHQALASIAQVVAMAGGDYMGGDRKAASYFM